MQKSPEYADTVGIQEEGTRPDASPAQNELYADFIVKYMGNFQEDLGDVPGISFQKINSIYGVVYAPLTEVGNLNINTYSYSFIPKCYTYMDLGSLGASGITRLQEHPYLQLKGQKTAIAVIDSGIDYRNPLFQNEMGSRILCIWDQNLDGDGREVPYGKVFWKSDIDRALASENPLDLVPSLDTNGHGTRMAAIAAGNYAPEEGFCGAAPEAMLIIVKVKQAKKYLREFYLFPSQAELFQENDIRCHFRSGICLERIVRQTDSTQQIGTFRDMLAGSAVFAVHRVAASDKSHDAARTHLVDGFGEKVVVDGKSQLVVRFVVDLILTERHIADCQIIEVPAVGGFKSSYRNVSLRIQLFGDTACDAVQLHTIQAAVLHGIRQHPKEVADTHTRFQDVA